MMSQHGQKHMLTYLASILEFIEITHNSRLHMPISLKFTEGDLNFAVPGTDFS